MEITNYLKFSRKSRYRVAKECPCGKSNKDGKFRPFEGYEDKGKGYCHSCNKTFLPDHDKAYKIKKMEKQQMYIAKSVMSQFFKNYDKCNFYRYMDWLTDGNAKQLFQKYNVGVSKGLDAIFWLVDYNDQICQPKIMKYDLNGNRQGIPFVPGNYTYENDFTLVYLVSIY